MKRHIHVSVPWSLLVAVIAVATGMGLQIDGTIDAIVLATGTTLCYLCGMMRMKEMKGKSND